MNKKREEYIFSIFLRYIYSSLVIIYQIENNEFGERVILELMQFEIVLILLCLLDIFNMIFVLNLSIIF